MMCTNETNFEEEKIGRRNRTERTRKRKTEKKITRVLCSSLQARQGASVIENAD